MMTSDRKTGRVYTVTGNNLKNLYPLEYELTEHIHKESESSMYSLEKSSTEDDLDGLRKRISGCGTWLLLVALITCGTACFLMMTTDAFALFVQKSLTLKNNSARFEAWRRPPIHAALRIYLFNYTNIEEYESEADTKLKVEEIGPYTYIETLERVNVTHHANGTLTYKDRKIYRFSEELSVGLETDRVTVPNIPYLGILAYAREQNFIVRMGILLGLQMVETSPFLNLGAGEFIWGYKDKLSDVTTNIVSFKYNVPVSNFGIMANKNRTQEDVVSVFTGEEDPTKTGIISEYGNKMALDYWHTKECNRIDGTDGTIYPPAAIKPNSTLYVYVKDMCRRIPMVYESSKLDQHGISVMRYHLDREVFASGAVNAENRCFCRRVNQMLDCMPSGAFNASPCAFGGPIVTSLPHFLYGDSALLEDFEGLSPDAERHESFVEIDRRLGLPLSGKSRFQLNVMMTKASRETRRYKDKLILPVSWMDYGVDRLPSELSSQIHRVILFIEISEVGLRCCFAFATVLFTALIIRKMVPRRRTGLFIKNLGVSTADMPLVVCQGKT